MARTKKLLSQSEYARQRGISQPYVHKLIRKGLIPTHAGGIDPREADQAREENTLIGGRRPAWVRRQTLVAAGYPLCQGCGEPNDIETAKALLSPDPEKFCSELCSGLGFTEAEMRDMASLLKW